MHDLSSRPKRTQISRSRTGCLACRQKRRKCDETRPRCKRCAKRGAACEYQVGLTYSFRDATTWAHQKVIQARGPGVASPPQSALDDRPAAAATAPVGGTGIVSGAGLSVSTAQPLDLDAAGADHASGPETMVESRPQHPSIEPNLYVSPDSLSTTLLGQNDLSGDKNPIPVPFPTPTSTTTATTTTTTATTTTTTATAECYAPPLQSGQIDPHDGICRPQEHDLYHEAIHGTDPHAFPEMFSVSTAGNTLGHFEIPVSPLPTFDCSDTLLDQPLYLTNDAISRLQYSLEGSNLTRMLTPAYPATASDCVVAFGEPTSSIGTSQLRGALEETNEGSSTSHSYSIRSLELYITSRADRIYLAHFNAHVLEILPGQCDVIRDACVSSSRAHFAAMSLAAANLANLQGCHGSSGGGKIWIPRSSHATRAIHFVTQVLSTPEANDNPVSLDELLCVHILLSLVEAEVGTVRGLRARVACLEDALGRSCGQVSESKSLMELWSASFNVRAILKCMDNPRSLLDVECSRRRRLTEVDETLVPLPSRISNMNSDAIRLSNSIILSRTMCFGCEDIDQSLARVGTWYDAMQGVSHPVDVTQPRPDRRTIRTDAVLFEKLRNLQEQLDDSDIPEDLLTALCGLSWDGHSFVTPNSDQPGSPPQSSPTSPLYTATRPIYFKTHVQAMDMANYAFAKIMCDTSLLQRLVGSSASLQANRTALSGGEDMSPQCDRRAASDGMVDQAMRWMSLLLQIAAGLDPAECARRNVYRLGIAQMLFYAGLRLMDPNVLAFCEEFLAGVEATGAPCEDAFTPAYMARRFISAVRHETTQGRTVFFAASTYSEFSPKQHVYSKELDEMVVVHGVDQYGRYFNDAVPLFVGTEV